MFGVRLFQSSYRHPLVWCLVLSLLVVQGLKIHFHAFSSHEPLHGHGHAVELHVGGMPTDSGHDDHAAGDAGLAKYAILKAKTVQADDLALPVTILVMMLFGLALASRTPWRPVRIIRPAPGGDVRTPPPRAPPR